MRKKPAPPSLKWPAFNVEARKIADLIPFAGNARTHSDAQISRIEESIKQWGWTNPILVDEAGGVIAGHGRLLAAERLIAAGEPFDEVPTIVARGWSEAQKRAYVLADNQLAIEGAGWDLDKLKIELQELESLHFDIDMIGFPGDFIADLFEAEKTEGDGEGAPGASDDVESLKWGDQKIPLRPDEFEGLNNLAASYVEMHGHAIGFARWLIDGMHVPHDPSLT